MRRIGLAVPPSLVLAKARKVAQSQGISEDDFKCSWKWLSRFRNRRGIGSMLLHGEGAEVDKDNPELLEALDKLYHIIREYAPENVYNMDETGLFFRMLPRYTLLLPAEDLSTTRGKKKVKERVSLVVCVNACGTHKIPCSMIGKPKNPACIAQSSWPIPYFDQKRAWMDVSVCNKWFNDVFFPAVRRRTARPVLLLLDNAPGHFDAFERDCVRVVFFPPNCTSWKQPCDMGIIAALKKRYKYLYLSDVLQFHDLDQEEKERKRELGTRLRRGAAGVAFGRPAHLLDAATYVKEAWDDSVPETTVKNCFRKAEIMDFGDDPVVDDNVEVDFGDILRDMSEIGSDDLKQFIQCDDEDNADMMEAVLDEVEEELAHLENNELPPEDYIEEEQDIRLPGQSSFLGLNNLYDSLLLIEEQLVSKEMQDLAGGRFNGMIDSFESLYRSVRELRRIEEAKNANPRRQMTIHDMLGSYK